MQEKQSKLHKIESGWRYLVVNGAFITYFVADGWAYSFGIIFTKLLEHFDESHAKTSIIGALIYAVPLSISPVICTFCEFYGHRRIGVIGGLICCVAFVVSSFAESVEILIVSLGILSSIGLSMIYLSSYLCVTIYFENNRGLAIGLAVTGSGLGAFAFPPLFEFLISEYSWRGCLFITGGIFLQVVVASLLFRPIKKPLQNLRRNLQSAKENDEFSIASTINTSDNVEEKELETYKVKNHTCKICSEIKAICMNMFDKELVRNFSYLTFCASTFITYLWIGTLYIYLVDKVILLGINESKAVFLLSLIGIGRTIGQIVLGYLGDVKFINTIGLYTASITVCGFCMLAVPFCKDYITLILSALMFGFFVSCTYTLQIICLVNMFGLEKGTNAFGFLQMVQGIATFLGSPLPGWMFDNLNDYNPPFYVAGSMLIFSGMLLLLVVFRHRKIKTETITSSFI